MTQSSTIMAVPVDIAAPTFSPGNPVAVVKGSFLTQFQGLSYAVSSDGKRFSVIKDIVNSSTPPQPRARVELVRRAQTPGARSS